MLAIEQYILLSKSDRQSHLRLDEPCTERGGPEKGGLSAYCKGLIAHILDTSIPTGKKIHVCHACNNSKCSNPYHLYWGTAKENRNDLVATGLDKSVWQRTVDKYGAEEASKMFSRKNNNNGSGNKGKSKSDEHKAKISASHKGGRKKKIDNADVM